MQTQWLGLTSYTEGLVHQQSASDKVRSGLCRQELSGIILGCEHRSTITLGKSIKSEKAGSSEFTVALKVLSEVGIEVVNTDRGGRATLHSPGQLVIYPILPLREKGISVRDYVYTLEQTSMEWLSELGIESFRSEDAGVFTSNGKIVFIGIRVDRGISRHGISINCFNDLSLFSNISSCGVRARALDSLCNYSSFEHQDLEKVFNSWVRVFQRKIQ